MTSLPFEAEAAAELDAAAGWYERERAGLGQRFLTEVGRVVALAARIPGSGAPVPDMPEAADVRRHLLKRFPFRVLVANVGGRRAVVAVAHMSRAPGYWAERLK